MSEVENIAELFEETAKFLASAAPDQLPALELLKTALKRKTFRVCITGGFSRGKSHFLNELLGAELLPEGAVPTTGCLTEICYDHKPAFEICQNGKSRQQGLDREALRAWTLGQCEPGAVLLRIYCPDLLLAQGLTLIDTPGLEDSLATSAEEAYTALENADAAIVLISAITPFSLTERQFVHVYLQGRSIPLLAFAVSFLDQLKAEDQERQLAYIRKKSAEIYPGCPLLTMARPASEPVGYLCGREKIRELLERWQNLPKLGALREKMLLERLRALLLLQKQKWETRLRLLGSDYAARQREVREAIENLDAHTDTCDKLRQEFGEKAQDMADLARRRIRSFGENCAADLAEGSLSEDELVESFQKLYEELANYVRDGLQNDLARLSRKLRDLYGLPLDFEAASCIPRSIGIPITREMPETSGSSWLLEQVLHKGQAVIDTFGAKLPYFNLIWPLLKPYFAELLDKAREYLPGGSPERAAREKQISLICSRMTIAFRDILDQIYAGVFEAIRETRLNWLEEQEKFLRESAELRQRQLTMTRLKSQLATAGELAARAKILMERQDG